MATKFSLDEVKSHFEHWRQNRLNTRVKIPDSLWRSAVALLKNYPLTEIIRTLRLSGDTFNKRKNLYARQTETKKIAQPIKKLAPLTVEMAHKPTNIALNPFIKIPMNPTPLPLTAKATSITLQRGDTQFSLNCPSDEQIQLIINALLR
jgi:hypothetical protein